jgi:hypothetical protein
MEDEIEDTAIENTESEAVSETGEGDIKGKIVAIINEFVPESETGDEENFIPATLKALTVLKTLHDKLLQVVEEFPEFGDFLNAVLKGMSPDEAVARYFDAENLTPPEDAPNFEQISTAKAERRKGIDELNARKQTLIQNEEISIKNVNDMIAKRGMDEESAKQFITDVADLSKDLFDGLLSENHIDVLLKGFEFPQMLEQKNQEIESAFEDGTVAGRNEQISKKRAGMDKGDGMVRLSNTGSSTDTAPKKAIKLREPFRV